LKTNKVVNSNKFVLSNDQFNTAIRGRNHMKVTQIKEDAQNKINHLKNMKRPESFKEFEKQNIMV